MADDKDDDTVDDIDPSSYEDPIAQRAAAFVLLAVCADKLANETARDLTFTMMRKLSATIRTPSTAELKTFEGGKI
jgi:hypothetical protein